MERIPFAQFVLNAIKNGEVQHTYGWMDNVLYWVNADRQIGNLGAFGLENKDDWNLTTGGFWGTTPYLVRGKEYVRIDLTKDEIIEFKAIIKDLKAKEKARIAAVKAAKKQMELDAQWWP